MAMTNKDVSIFDATPDVHAIMGDIASLKQEIATLADRVKDSAVNATSDAARSAVSQLSDGASHIYENLAAQGERSAKAISRQVEEQPFKSLLIAFALGFVGSRLMSR